VRKRIRRPSPALAISLIALFVALGGTGYAAITISGKNIKNNSVTGKDIKNKSLTGKDVKGNSLTGTQVNESRLGKVHSAGKADSATTATNAQNAVNAQNASTVGGAQIGRFSLIGGNDAPNREILNLAGLSLQASCAGGSVEIKAMTTVADGEISVTARDASGASTEDDYEDSFDPGEEFVFPTASNSDVLGQGTYSGGDGRTVTFLYNEEDDLPAGQCVLSGYAIG
jgi:hypothetical protein